MRVVILILLGLIMWACTKEGELPFYDEYQYHVHLYQPTDVIYNIGSSIYIDAVFESHTGATVQYVSVEIIKDSEHQEVLYTQPQSTYVHDLDGVYNFKDTLTVSIEKGFEANTNYVLKAKVWGAEDGEAEVEYFHAFHVKP